MREHRLLFGYISTFAFPIVCTFPSSVGIFRLEVIETTLPTENDTKFVDMTRKYKRNLQHPLTAYFSLCLSSETNISIL